MAAFELDLEQNLWALHEELREKTYQPGPYRHFTIREPKTRRISAAPFRDRVVHHALMQVTWPIFEARMIHDSYACRVGKGAHTTGTTTTGFASPAVAGRMARGMPVVTSNPSPAASATLSEGTPDRGPGRCLTPGSQPDPEVRTAKEDRPRLSQ